MVYIIGSVPIEKKEGIVNQIREDSRTFLKNGDTLGVKKCRLLLGEIQRDPNKDDSDKNVTKILKKIRKQTLKNKYENDSILVELIDTYIPRPISDKEVIEWVEMRFSDDVIKEMGRKRAFSIIGEAKKHFEGDINVDCIKEKIMAVLEEEHDTKPE